jgi:two-component system, NtrC family, nitrogen regulation sensor histidine kinase NtrY
MSLRSKLVLLVTLGIAASVTAVALLIEASTRKAFRQVNQQRTEALVAQFRREFEREADEITRAVDAIANSEQVLEMGLKLAGGGDSAAYINQAAQAASVHRLDFLDLLAADGTIISSAHWPARFGYKQLWFLEPPAAIPQRIFLREVETPQGSALGILCIRTVHAHGVDFYVFGGRTLDSALLQSLATPAGMRILVYRSSQQGASGFLSSTQESFDPQALMPLVERAVEQPSDEPSATVSWGNGAQEVFYAISLLGFGDRPAAVLLVGNSLARQQSLERRIAKVGVIIALSGIVLGLILSNVIAAHVTRPVKELAEAAAKIGEGNWQVRVEPSSQDEIGRLASAFNHMTEELIAQKERLVQTERVAAWRELARRLAHELKNPLFPLQLTVENLLRSREAAPEQFEEVFRESTSTLLAEIANLKTIIGRFSDFSRMPAPQLQPLDLNETIRGVMHLFQGQFQRENGRIEINLEFASVPSIQADPTLLRRVIENLVLNAIDAMPMGGRLTSRTQVADRYAIFEISDTGAGLTPEECERLFTPYYTSKQHGTGLGLAIVQSVISDHHGRITVSSRKEQGTTFRVELPLPATEAEQHQAGLRG